ncbi:hypothetical protein [Phytomonospora endophytica]|uniref:Uncharacterized protein n=1 Tax=Phytomonospora endophytica TaxID=714109 RepID=A0A841FTS5_9ACTN|nr:hypothetical protein [Phytomonospora endophytica]MBB6036737.1 hypothetical protein [Phytomonospora endophytica]GIG68229.1 hypothetical protein Pen01_45240 [Phytomonospora endophytica]
MDATQLIVIGTGGVLIAALLLAPFVPGLRRIRLRRMYPPFRAWSARLHPDSPHQASAGRRVSRDLPDSSRGAVVVRTGHRGRLVRDIDLDWRVSRPLAPVVYADGTPVSWGWGETRVELPAGRHLIAVGTSHSRSYREVDVEAGAVTVLRHASLLSNGAHDHHKPDASATGVEFVVEKGWSGFSWTALIVAALLALFTALEWSILSGASPAGDMWGVIGVALAIVAGIAFVAYVTVRVVTEMRKESRPAVPVPAPPALLVRDQDFPAAVEPPAGWSLIDLWLRYELERLPREDLRALAGGRLGPWRWWRARTIGEPRPPRYRAWIPEPTVSVDGNPVRAGWTRCSLAVPPGEHEVVVTVDGPPGSPGEGVTSVRKVSTMAGARAEVEVVADVLAVSRADGPGLARFEVSMR